VAGGKRGHPAPKPKPSASVTQVSNVRLAAVDSAAMVVAAMHANTGGVVVVAVT